jgi:hypothetical protein
VCALAFSRDPRWRRNLRAASSNDAPSLLNHPSPHRPSTWLPEEYATLLTARRATPPTAPLKARSLGVFTSRGITKDMLPRKVDWRGSGADGVVKDQATCGSCWVGGGASWGGVPGGQAVQEKACETDTENAAPSRPLRSAAAC